MGIDLLAISDRDLVRKTGTIIRVETLSGEIVDYNTYLVNIDLLYYNPDCYEIAPSVAYYDYVNGQGALRELSKAVEKREEYNVIVDSFIENKNNVRLYGRDDVYFSYPRTECGVILRDGKLMNGIQEFAMLRNEKAYLSKKVFFETIIYDEYEKIDEETTASLEVHTFLAAEYMEENKIDYDSQLDYYCIHSKYNALEQSVGIYNNIANNRIDIEECRINKEIEEYVKFAEILNEYLEYIKLPKQYAFIEKQKNWREIERIALKIANLDIDNKEQPKVTCFNCWLLNFNIPWYDVNVIYDTFSDERCDKLWEEQMKFNQEVEALLANADINDENDLCTFIEQNFKLKEQLEGLWKQMYNMCRMNRMRDAVVNDYSICELELSARSLNCLKRAGIETTKKLMEYDEEKLKTVRNITTKVIKELVDVIDELKKLV